MCFQTLRAYDFATTFPSSFDLTVALSLDIVSLTRVREGKGYFDPLS
jgi:hypothetical protein